VASAPDWHAWHEAYDVEDSQLARRLRVVQGHIAAWLDERPHRPLRALSVCAGQGRDLLGVLAARSDGARVRAVLIEADERNAAAARRAALAAGLTGVEIRCADAGRLDGYAGAIPADLVLLCGVLGNVAAADVWRTIDALPALCASGATVVWTKSRRPPDLTPAIRSRLAAAGFAERAFDAPADVRFTVGAHVLAGAPRPAATAGRLFTFVR
jgi:hypothetical protein